MVHGFVWIYLLWIILHFPLYRWCCLALFHTVYHNFETYHVAILQCDEDDEQWRWSNEIWNIWEKWWTKYDSAEMTWAKNSKQETEQRDREAQRILFYIYGASPIKKGCENSLDTTDFSILVDRIQFIVTLYSNFPLDFQRLFFLSFARHSVACTTKPNIAISVAGIRIDDREKKVIFDGAFIRYVNTNSISRLPGGCTPPSSVLGKGTSHQHQEKER